MREVHLHGARAEIFRLEVASPAEAVRALLVLRPELRPYFHDNDWHVVIGAPADGYAVDAAELGLNAGRQTIHFLPAVAVAGGRGLAVGKIILGAVLIATAVFFPPAAIMAGGSLAAVGITQAAVFGLGASMLLGGTAMLLSPTPRAPRAFDQAHPEERQSFFFNGPTNVSEPGVAVPLAYGYFRIGTIVVNAGLWNENVSAEEVEAGATTTGARTIERLEAPWPVLTTPVVVEKGGGKGGTPGGSYAPREAPNTLRSRSVVRIHEILCEGTIEGPPDPVRWGRYVFLDGTPMQTPAGNWNFIVQAAHIRLGLPHETPMPNFPAGEATVAVGVEVRNGEPVLRRVENPEASIIKVNILVPRLMLQKSNGDVEETKVDFRVEYLLEGSSWVTAVTNRIEGKTTTGYERTVAFRVPGHDDKTLDIRVVRISPDHDTLVGHHNETIWSSLVEVVEGRLRHDDTAAVGLVVDAEQFPSIPKRAYEFRWLIVAVPTNYDPETRTYSGDWNGTFKQAWTDNPAWILYDLLTSRKHGLGRELDAQAIDKWSFYAAAVYNDGLVDDGAGGKEPRFTFNGLLNTQQEAALVLQSVASVMRAQFYTAGGIVMLAQDRPAPSFARIFTAANVEQGSFDYQSTEARSRHTHVNVSWVDPEDTWQAQIEPVPYPEMMDRFGYIETGIYAIGCTSRSQALRAGRYFLFGAHHEQETVSFVVGLENADLRPGDLIAIQDAQRAAVEWGGRVAHVEGQTVTLDRIVNSRPLGTMYLAQSLADSGATMRTVTVSAWPTADSVTVDGSLAGIGTDAIWAIANTSVQLRQWRVVSVAEQESLRFQVTAVFHDPRKYDFVEKGVLRPERSYDALPSGPLKPPGQLKAEEYYSLDPTGAPRGGLTFSWKPPADARVIHFVADAVGPGKVGQHWSTINGTSVTLDTAKTGEWKFSVASVDAIGRRSVAVSITVNPAALARTPLPPLAFRVGQQSNTSALLTWALPDDLSISYWLLKWTPEVDPINVSWDAATILQRIIPRQLLSIVVRAQTGTYLLKSVSVRGKECTSPARALLSMYDLRPVGAEHIEQPTWPGAMTNCAVEDEELVMHGPPALAFYQRRAAGESWPPPLTVPWQRLHATRLGVLPFAEAIATMEYVSPVLSLIQNAQFMARVTLAGRGVMAGDLMANWIPIAVAEPLVRTSSAAWESYVEEHYADDPAGPWSDWEPAGVADVQARCAQFRLLGAVYDVAVDLKFTRMEERLNLTAHEQQGSDITNASGVCSIALDPDYYQPPAVQPRITGAGVVNLIVSAVSGSAFTVNSYTAAGAVAPNIPFTWTALGYGRTP